MPVAMSGYGMNHMATASPELGAATYAAQRREVNFARYVELEKLNLQKRALRQQAAAQAAKIQEAQQDRADALAMRREEMDREAAIQQTKFDLEERRLDMAYEESQRKREDYLDAYEQTERQRQERGRRQLLEDQNSMTAIGAVQWDGAGQRPQKYFTDSSGRIWNLDGVDMEAVRNGSRARQSSEGEGAAGSRGIPGVSFKDILKESNDLSSKGAREVDYRQDIDPETEYPYYSLDGRLYAVPRIDKDGNPIASKKNASPVEGYADKAEFNVFAQRYGAEVASDPNNVGNLKLMDSLLKENAVSLGIIKVDKQGNILRDAQGDFSIEKLREMANAEKTFMKSKKLEDVNTPWQDEYEKAKAMVKLHDALDDYRNQKDGNASYDNAKRKYMSGELPGVYSIGLQAVIPKRKSEKEWNEHGKNEYSKTVHRKFMDALNAAKDLGWDIPSTKDEQKAYAFIDEQYRIFMPGK